MCLIPGGDSDSLWYSYSPAYTAFGYHIVIRMITGRPFTVEDHVYPQDDFTTKRDRFQDSGTELSHLLSQIVS